MLVAEVSRESSWPRRRCWVEVKMGIEMGGMVEGLMGLDARREGGVGW